MARILVGTIFARDDEVQRKWLELQLAFIKATTPSFEHMSVVWGGVTHSSWNTSTTVIEPEVEIIGSEAHLKGLRYLKDIFCQRQEGFDGFLFLDSDAFPIRVGWLDSLLSKLKSIPTFYDGNYIPMQTGKEYEIAMPIRAENLETRYHASVLYATKSALPHLSFEYGVFGPDMCGERERDIYLPEYQGDRKDKVWPLLRSNQKNVHPLACGIYYDMFYHHCCGSERVQWMRSDDYWNNICTNSLDDFTKRLMKSPVDFVRELAGWSLDKYAQI